MLDVIQNKKDRMLVWHDEFYSNEIDSNKWTMRMTMGGNDRIYDNSEKHVRLENGMVHLQVNETGNLEKPWSLPAGFTTYNKMLFKYGYLEMRAKIPFRHGAWPSFWMQSATPFKTVEWFSEVDIFEVFSSPNRVLANIHKWQGDKHSMLGTVLESDKRAYVFDDFANINDEFHVYGYEWDKNCMRFYVDEVQFCEFPIDEANCQVPNDLISGVEGFHDFHFIIMNNEMFTPNGGWVNPEFTINENDIIPIDYYIDWVRLYQKEGEEIMLTEEISNKL